MDAAAVVAGVVNENAYDDGGACSNDDSTYDGALVMAAVAVAAVIAALLQIEC